MYLLKRSKVFEHSFKKFIKKHPYKQKIVAKLKEITKGLEIDPTFAKYTIKASEEPISYGFLNESASTFWKIRFTAGKGAAGQIRLMYLVNDAEKIVILIYIYDHKQYAKRPPDDYLKNVIRDAIDEM